MTDPLLALQLFPGTKVSIITCKNFFERTWLMEDYKESHKIIQLSLLHKKILLPLQRTLSFLAPSNII